MHEISVEERRARLGLRHRLAVAAGSVEEAVSDVVAFHSSDPTTVYLSAWARVRDFTRDSMERSLYEARTLVRMLGMRRTLFVVPADAAQLVQRGCTDDILAAERRRLVPLLEDQGIADDGESWLRTASESALAELHDRGEAATAHLTTALPELAGRVTMGAGRWAADVSLSSRVLFLLAAEGRILRTRPRGSWISSHYHWAPTVDWLGAPLADVDPETARSELLRRWLARFGPATARDIRWWMGWTMAKTNAALEALPTATVTVDGAEAHVASDDVDPVSEPGPWVAMLPGLDPTTMGWKERGWYLGDHGAELFDSNGNAGPTIWADGRIVGGWSQQRDGTVVTQLLEDVGTEAAAAIEQEAGRLEAWLDGVVTPRFPTPLSRRLSGR